MARAIWSGSISFGLVNIPIRLFTAVREQSIHLHMLNDEGDCRLRRKLYCPETGKEYDFKETARGYEVAPDQYVIIEQDELESIKPEKGRTIEISDFVELEQIDPIYYNRTYYVGPDERGSKGYQLLLQALEQQNKVGIAKFVMRDKEYLVALRPKGRLLVMETMYFANEIVNAAEEIDLPKAAKIDKKELAMAEKLIEALVGDFDPKKYQDEYRARMLELIEQKAEGREVLVEEPAAEAEPTTMNFMKVLEASLKEAKAGAAKPRGPRGPRAGAATAGKRGRARRATARKKRASSRAAAAPRRKSA